MSKLPPPRTPFDREIETFAGRLLTNPNLRRAFVQNPEGTLQACFSQPDKILNSLGGAAKLRELGTLVSGFDRSLGSFRLPQVGDDICWIHVGNIPSPGEVMRRAR